MKITAGDRVQLKTRHRVILTVTLDLLVINIVIAEATKEEIGELIE